MNFSKFIAYTNRLCYTKQIKRKGADAVTNLNTYFQKHGLCAENILYIYRRDRKTVIKRTDGEEFALFFPISSILAVLLPQWRQKVACVLCGRSVERYEAYAS